MPTISECSFFKTRCSSLPYPSTKRVFHIDVFPFLSIRFFLSSDGDFPFLDNGTGITVSILRTDDSRFFFLSGRKKTFIYFPSALGCSETDYLTDSAEIKMEPIFLGEENFTLRITFKKKNVALARFFLVQSSSSWLFLHLYLNVFFCMRLYRINWI